jgi:hypothetical protein
LDRSIVDKDIDLPDLFGRLTHTLGRIRIAEIAGERRHLTARIFQPYLSADGDESRLITRDQQQIGSMRGKLVST